MSQKKPEAWSPTKIKSELEDAGISLAKLSEANGYAVSICSRAIKYGNEIGQELIARALKECCGYPNLTVQMIWPERYDGQGRYIKPKMGRKSLRGPIFPDLSNPRNTQLKQAA